MAGGPISWRSRSQETVALSTMEAEYMAAATATQEAFWLRFLLEEMGLNVATPIVLREDNKTRRAYVLQIILEIIATLNTLITYIIL